MNPPRYVNIAFYLFLLVALTRLVSIIVSISQFGTVAAMARSRIADQAAGSGVSQATLEATIRGSLIGGIVVSLLFLVAFVVFDLLMRRGANWARIVLLVITVLSITGVISTYGIGALGVVAGIVATVLMFLAPSNDYFRAVKAQKLEAAGGQYGQPGGYPPPAQQ